MTFEWDEKKAAANFKKHGVSFDEAQTVFEDPFFLIYRDHRYFLEQRFIITDESKQHRLLVVAYTERGPRTRLISARLATGAEQKSYEENT